MEYTDARGRLRLRKSRRTFGLLRQTHGDFFPTDPQYALGMYLIDTSPCKEGATDVNRVVQSLEHKWADAEFCQVLPELEVDAGCLAQDLEPFASGGGPDRELWYWLQLRWLDAQCHHCLGRDGVGEVVAAVDEGRSGQAPQSNRDVHAVVSRLTGLEVDLRNLSAGGGHRCKTGQSMNKHFLGQDL